MLNVYTIKHHFNPLPHHFSMHILVILVMTDVDVERRYAVSINK